MISKTSPIYVANIDPQSEFRQVKDQLQINKFKKRKSSIDFLITYHICEANATGQIQMPQTFAI